jgi:lipopolysaccharide/colanic/teichoic acid biosynthesis glycosyltransferase
MHPEKPKEGLESPPMWDNEAVRREFVDSVPPLAQSSREGVLPKMATVDVNIEMAPTIEDSSNYAEKIIMQDTGTGRGTNDMSLETFSPAVSIERRKSADDLVKRSLDITFAVAALTVLSLPIGVIALCIKLTDGGQIIYMQERVGRDGRTFKFFKFRSMVQNADALKEKLAEQNEADGPIFKMKNDPRITPIGRFIRKWSLDELPQFLNVLRGDMSLVGPRPHLPSEIEAYENYPLERLSVQPGLLCLREVTGRSSLSFEQWLASDLEYVKNRSLWLDIQILLKAVPAILLAKGAY